MLAAACLTACRLPEAPGAPPLPPLTAAVPAPPRATEFFLYEVRKGDTLYSLGEQFRVPWRGIAAANGLGPPYRLSVGTPLFIPRMPGVAVPELMDPTEFPPPPPRRAVSRADLHRGNPSSAFWWPTAGRLSRRYGDQVRGMPEPGIAIAAPAGTEVCAAASGTVVTAMRGADGSGSAWGNVVAVRHAGKVASWYAHLDSILVAKGARVEKGQPIATVGTSGAAARPELAFRMFRDERFVNPEDFLP